MIVQTENIDDPRLEMYTNLTDVRLRTGLEFAQGVFVAESMKVIERALDAGMHPLSFLTEEKWLEGIAGVIASSYSDLSHIPVFVLPHEQIARLAGYEVTRGALAVFKRPSLLPVQELLKDAHRVAILEDITNHTNVGAIFRSAAALGVDAVLVTPGCYDPLYRRAIRVSMGTVFQVPWTRIGADNFKPGVHGNVNRKGGWLESGIPLLKEAGFKVAALALTDNSMPLDDPTLKKEQKLALVLGTEGEGLSDNTIAQSDYVVRIPMAAGVDSLNVAAASAVAFWELRWRDNKMPPAV